MSGSASSERPTDVSMNIALVDEEVAIGIALGMLLYGF